MRLVARGATAPPGQGGVISEHGVVKHPSRRCSVETSDGARLRHPCCLPSPPTHFLEQMWVSAHWAAAQQDKYFAS